MKVKCQRCGNEWEYNGDKIKLSKKYPQYVSCSKCRTSVKLDAISSEDGTGRKK